MYQIAVKTKIALSIVSSDPSLMLIRFCSCRKKSKGSLSTLDTKICLLLSVIIPSFETFFFFFERFLFPVQS